MKEVASLGKSSASERPSTWRKSAGNYLAASSRSFYTRGSTHLFNHNRTRRGPPLYGKGKKLEIFRYLEIETSAGKGLDRRSHVQRHCSRLHSVAYGSKHNLSASSPQLVFTQILLSKSAFDQNSQLGRTWFIKIKKSS